jgi:predicted phage baseplate assembly protein
VTLPAPNLDDRRFQDLVDDAKRYVQQNCPQWSDHNVSDPGVTLIETFAMMTDQLFYRLNRVPDRLYLRFLELLGLPFVRPTAAAVDVTFWLTAPQPDVVRIPAGTEVATRRTSVDEAIPFETTEDLAVVPCSLVAVAARAEGGTVTDRTEDWRLGHEFPVFSEVPVEGDAVLLGLSEAVPRCAVTLRFDNRVRGSGIRPDDPPWIWEAWNGGYWEPCELEPGGDGTGGFNRPGDVVLHVPPTHRTSVVEGHRAGWLRCRFARLHGEQSLYEESPMLRGITAFTIGGTIPAAHQETVRAEMLGLSTGVPGQRFDLTRGPLLTGPVVVEVADGEGWRPWTEVPGFDVRDPEDAEHFTVDVLSGQVVFAPATRLVNGSVRRLGAVPPAAAPIRVTYRVGGGRRGNVLRGAIRTLRTQLPAVTRVENRRAASGGVDGEDLDAARERAPAFLRTRDRAVTKADYEYLAHDADPRVGRVRAVTGADEDPGMVRVVLVPLLNDDPTQPPARGAFNPSNELLARVAGHLDERRVLGTRLTVTPPHFEPVSVDVIVRRRRAPNGDEVDKRILAVVHRYLHPLQGGPDGAGWPFGRSLTSGELLGVLQRALGLEIPEAVRLYRVDPRNWTRPSGWTNRIDLGPGVLPFSFEHRVKAEDGS